MKNSSTDRDAQIAQVQGRAELVEFDTLLANLLAPVCKQLKADGRLRLDYPQRLATLHVHKQRLREYLGLYDFAAEEQPELIPASERSPLQFLEYTLYFYTC